MIDFSSFDRLFGFGDSTVDSGYIGFLLPNQVPSSLGFFELRFSNGPNYFDQIFAEISGLAPEAYENILSAPFGGVGVPFGASFAIGGSTAIGSGFGTFEDQITNLNVVFADEDRFGTAFEANDLIAVNLGGNDLFDFLNANADLVVTQAELDTFADSFADAFVAPLTALIALGAEHILLSGAPNVGVTPTTTNTFFGGDQSLAIATVAPFADALNDALLEVIDEVAAGSREVSFYFFDPVFDDALSDPASIGLDPALLSRSFQEDFLAPGSTVTLEDLPSYLFIDDVHVTAAGQNVLFAQASDAAVLSGPLAILDEFLEGTAGDDVIDGYGGNDTIVGGLGSDSLYGGDGDDVLVGGMLVG